jgi:hypothetical protein
MTPVQVICRKCLRKKGRYPWSEGYLYGLWMWWKINFFMSKEERTKSLKGKHTKKVRILCSRCAPYTFE